jgi:hypothetical protein
MRSDRDSKAKPEPLERARLIPSLGLLRTTRATSWGMVRSSVLPEVMFQRARQGGTPPFLGKGMHHVCEMG